MSYILDALKKSEQQRQQGATPMTRLAQAGPAAPRRRALSLNGTIALVLVGVGVAIGWSRPWQHETGVPAPAPAGANSSAPGAAFVMPAPDPVVFERNGQQRPPPATSPMASGPARTEAVEATAPAVPAAPERAGTASANVAPAAADAPPEMPGLTISMHGYSSDPKERMVMINGKLLREGEYLSADLRLIQVTPEGVLVDYQGNRFQRARR